FFGIFIYYLAAIARDSRNNQQADKDKKSLVKIFAALTIGLLGLAFGGNLVARGAVDIASRLGVSQSFIGLTIVAIGTSLPELATSAVAACKKNSDIAVGNIIGSNIFNIFFILGISALIKPLPLTGQINTDILVLIGASLLLFFFMFTGNRRTLDRWEGVVFILLYIGYLVFLIERG
ncbi:MAG: sodium:calcium antiporter, partial [Candidatus Omnitrophica bacterium]|nr:sodium:calcium antiporter [Candidatus Omnitrophota bacterium]